MLMAWMPRPGGVLAKRWCTLHSLGTVRAARIILRRITALALSSAIRSAGVPRTAAKASRRRDEFVTVLHHAAD